MITIVFLEADPPMNFWARAELSSSFQFHDMYDPSIETEYYIEPILLRSNLWQSRYKNLLVFYKQRQCENDIYRQKHQRAGAIAPIMHDTIRIIIGILTIWKDTLHINCYCI